MKITFLGSGTSSGVPTIGCDCAVCLSTDMHDKRLRPSIWLRDGERSIVIDTSSDFRQQCIRAGVNDLDAVVYTHHHFDHIAGFDDLRAFNFKTGRTIPVYMMPETLAHIRQIFSYAFTQDTVRESSVPLITIHEILDDPFSVGGIEFIPIHLRHGSMRVNGYRIGDFAYCTDCNQVTEEGMERLRGVRVLVLDALRHSEHKTHFSLAQAIEVAGNIGADMTYFTHIAHEILHEEVERGLPAGMHLAYDGLEFVLD